MGSTNKYNSKDFLYVPTKMVDATGGAGGTPQTILFGFLSNVESAVRNDLGLTELPEANYSNPPEGLVWKASFPTPPRASKRFAAEIASSYCSAAKVAELRRKLWNVSEPLQKSPAIINGTTGMLVAGVYVNIPTKKINYGWNIPTETLTRLQTFAGWGDLNIKIMTASDKGKVVFGIGGTGKNKGYPVPPRGRCASTVGTAPNVEINTHTTFYEPGITLPDDFVPLRPAILEIVAR